MSPNDKFLLAFSIVFIAVISLLLVVPILRRKIDVFTTWNFFLLGAIIFNGFSAFNATRGKHYLPSYQSSDYALYYLGTILFYASAFLAYYQWKYPRRAAGRRLRKWPQLTGWTLVILTLVLTLSGLANRYPLPIPVIGQLMFQFGLAGPILGFACAFIAWYRSPGNVLLMMLMLFIAATTLITVLGVGGSRRYLMSFLAVAPLCLYWVWLRYKPTHVMLTWILATVFIGVPVLKGFSEIRHQLKHRGTAFERSVLVLQNLPRAILSGGSAEGFMGQDSVECALLTIHMLHDRSDRLQVRHFFAPYYVLSNPVPRAFWPEKPKSLGLTLPETARIKNIGSANLGVNVVGQCFYDGGLYIHVLYGVLCAGFMRFYDELLVRQAGNPVLIGGLVFLAPQIIGFPRGSIDALGLQVILGFFSVLLTCFMSRIVFGTGITYPRTDHLVDYPNLRCADR